MNVLDDYDQGPLPSDALEEPADRPEDLLLGCCFGRQPDRRTDPGSQKVAVALVAEHGAKLVACALAAVSLVDPGRAPDDLGNRPVGDPLAVRQTVAAQDRRLAGEAGDELGNEATLADAGRAEQGEQAGGPVVDGPSEGLLEAGQFSFSADERAFESAAPAGLPGPDGQEAIGDDRQSLALGCDRLHALDLDSIADEVQGDRSEEDLAGRSGLLEACGGIDRVAGHEGLAGRRVAGHDLAGVDAGTELDRDTAAGAELGVEGGQLGRDLGRGPDRPKSIVLMEGGDTEDGHDGVADELLDGAAVTLDDRPHHREVAAHDRPHRLRVELLAQDRRADDVGEQDGDDFANVTERGYRAERCRASRAEPGPIGVLCAARRTGSHGGIVLTDPGRNRPASERDRRGAF